MSVYAYYVLYLSYGVAISIQESPGDIRKASPRREDLSDDVHARVYKTPLILKPTATFCVPGVAQKLWKQKGRAHASRSLLSYMMVTS